MDKLQLDVDTSPVKVGAICSVSVLLAIFAGYAMSRIAGGAEELSALVIATAAVVAWISVSTLKAFIIKSLKIGLTVSLLEAVAAWVFLPDRFSKFAIVSGIAVFLFFAVGFVKGRREIGECLKVRFLRAGSAVSKTAMTGLAIFATLTFLGSFGFPELSIPRGAFEFAFAGSDRVIANFIPGFSSEASVDEVLRNFVRSQLPQGTPDAVIIQSVSELKRAIADGVGLRLTGGEPVMDALYALSSEKLDGLSPALKLVAMIVIGILAFGIAKTAAFILNWFVIIFSYLFYQMLLAFNFMHVVYENRGKEIIVVD